MGAAVVGVTCEILCTTFFARTGMKTRAFMRYSAHVSGGAPRSERSSRGCAASADPGATRADSHRNPTATQEQLQSREREIEHLKLLLAKLHRMQFGRKSEKLERQIEQLELRLEELESKRSEKERNAPEPAPVTASSTPAAAKPTRRALPDHLPRQTRRHEPKETVCPQCQGELRKLGEDVSEMLEYVPASFVVIRHVRPKLSCTKCDCIVQAEAPSRPIARGMAGPGLLAHVLVRSTAIIFRCIGNRRSMRVRMWNWSARRMADWVGGSSQLLSPLVEALRRYVTAAE